jgi:hypothetical protein
METKEKLKHFLGISSFILVSCILLASAIVNKTDVVQTKSESTYPEKEETKNKENSIVQKHEIIMCSGVNNGLPIDVKNEFSGWQKIYAYVKWLDLSVGKHEVEFYWMNPKGKIQDYYKQEFTPTESFFNTWSWLQLYEFTSVFVTDCVHNNVSGNWRVEIFLDKDYVTKQSFTIK